MDTAMGILAIVIFIVILIAYFIPTAVAVNRDHPSQGGIIVLNIFLGWTFIGWVISLAWSLSDTGRDQKEALEQGRQSYQECSATDQHSNTEDQSAGYQTTYWDEEGRLRCSECNLVAYPNEARARQVASEAEGRFLRAYFENRCRNWHLDSQQAGQEEDAAQDTAGTQTSGQGHGIQ